MSSERLRREREALRRTDAIRLLDADRAMEREREAVRAGPPPLTVFLTFISRKDNSHGYTHLILALGIVREPTVWGFIISKYIFDEK